MGLSIENRALSPIYKEHMKKSGQSTIEYILLVTAVVAVVIILTTGQNSLFQQKLTNTINITAEGMQSMASKLTNSATTP